MRKIMLLVFVGAFILSGCGPGNKEVDHETGSITLSDGASIYFSKWGNGPEKIIVPAALFLERDFKTLMSKERTIVFYDMRNRGRSSYQKDSTLLTIQQDVKDLDEIRKYFNFERVSLIGYSYLGLMVVLYANENPERVSRIIQVGPVPARFGTKYKDEFNHKDSIPAIDTVENNKLNRLYAENFHVKSPKEFCEMDWSVMKFMLVGDSANASKLEGVCDFENEWPVNLYRHFQFHFQSVQLVKADFEKFKNVQCPVLVIHGTKDRNAPYGSGREWAFRLTDARLITVSNAAHNLWVEDNIFPDLNTFFSGKWPNRAMRVEETPVSEN